jgi:hypothetical protein
MNFKIKCNFEILENILKNKFSKNVFNFLLIKMDSEKKVSEYLQKEIFSDLSKIIEYKENQLERIKNKFENLHLSCEKQNKNFQEIFEKIQKEKIKDEKEKQIRENERIFKLSFLDKIKNFKNYLSNLNSKNSKIAKICENNIFSDEIKFYSSSKDIVSDIYDYTHGENFNQKKTILSEMEEKMGRYLKNYNYDVSDIYNHYLVPILKNLFTQLKSENETNLTSISNLAKKIKIYIKNKISIYENFLTHCKSTTESLKEKLNFKINKISEFINPLQDSISLKNLNTPDNKNFEVLDSSFEKIQSLEKLTLKECEVASSEKNLKIDNLNSELSNIKKLREIVKSDLELLIKYKNTKSKEEDDDDE